MRDLHRHSPQLRRQPPPAILPYSRTPVLPCASLGQPSSLAMPDAKNR